MVLGPRLGAAQSGLPKKGFEFLKTFGLSICCLKFLTDVTQYRVRTIRLASVALERSLVPAPQDAPGREGVSPALRAKGRTLSKAGRKRTLVLRAARPVAACYAGPGRVGW